MYDNREACAETRVSFVYKQLQKLFHVYVPHSMSSLGLVDGAHMMLVVVSNGLN